MAENQNVPKDQKYDENQIQVLEGLEAVHLDRREVSEEVLTLFIGGNEAIALGVIKPLHGTGSHIANLHLDASPPDARCSAALDFWTGKNHPAEKPEGIKQRADPEPCLIKLTALLRQYAVCGKVAREGRE